MHASKMTGLVAAGVVAAVTLESVQWPAYKVPGKPRLPDGRVDMNAPVPRTADGKPDLSGTRDHGDGLPGEQPVHRAPGRLPDPRQVASLELASSK
jgi:hypothetical protein